MIGSEKGPDVIVISLVLFLWEDNLVVWNTSLGLDGLPSVSRGGIPVAGTFANTVVCEDTTPSQRNVSPFGVGHSSQPDSGAVSPQKEGTASRAASSPESCCANESVIPQ